jgi:crossover junction endodeoxyribonuclease RuvC
MTAVAYDVIKCRPKLSMGERLCYIYRCLLKIIDDYKPDALSIETPFVSENARTALVIGKAQAIALLAAAINDIPAFEYSPAEIKYNAASYGNSSKEQVQQMVRLQLNLQEARLPSDSADALAAAICHFRQSNIRQITGGK